MIDELEVALPAVSGDKKRKAYIYLPEDYGKSNIRYPVMYMFDGHNLFFDSQATYGKSWGLKKYLDENAVPLIIASVECNKEGNCRLSEYSPVNFSFRGSEIKGKGRKYMQWLTGTFKPYIDSAYMTLPDRKHTAIGGSSMGGLMTLYALSVYNGYFSLGAALSPSLWVYGGVPPFVAKGAFRKDTVLYTDYGSKEFKNHEGQKIIFRDTVSALMDKDVAVTARIVAGGTHSEASWEKQIPFFMRALGFVNGT